MVMVVNIQSRVSSYKFYFEKWDASLSKKIVPFAGLTGRMLCQRVPLLSLRFASTSRTK